MWVSEKRAQQIMYRSGHTDGDGLRLLFHGDIVGFRTKSFSRIITAEYSFQNRKEPLELSGLTIENLHDNRFKFKVVTMDGDEEFQTRDFVQDVEIGLFKATIVSIRNPNYNNSLYASSGDSFLIKYRIEGTIDIDDMKMTFKYFKQFLNGGAQTSTGLWKANITEIEMKNADDFAKEVIEAIKYVKNGMKTDYIDDLLHAQSILASRPSPEETNVSTTAYDSDSD